MKNLFFVINLFVLTISACEGATSSVPKDPYSKESKVILEKWIAAFNNLNVAAL